MRKILILSVDNHFIQDRDGKIYNQGIVNKAFWSKYLSYYSKVYVFARVSNVVKNTIGYVECSCDNVEFIKVPMFRSVKELCKNFLTIRKIVKYTVNHTEFTSCVIRVPSLLGYIVYYYTRVKNRPIGIEVVANLDIVQKNASPYSLIKNKIFSAILKRIAKKADGVAYVTAEALQKVYPANDKAVVTNYSSVELSSGFYYNEKRLIGKVVKLLHVSTLNSRSKGHEVLFEITRKLIDKGYLVETIILGDGSATEYYKKLASSMNLTDVVTFIGNIADKMKLRDYYCTSDILVFPSEFEGLPRTVIEAMACSLACVVSDIDGNNELIEPQYRCGVKSTDEYIKCIENLVTNQDEYERVCKRNYTESLNYSHEILQTRRNNFFENLERG